jgi:hypothetical protein
MWALYLLAWLRSGKGAALRRRVFGMLRVGLYLAVVASIGTVLLVRRALGEIREQTATLGKELLPLADLLESTTVLRVNGEPLFFSMTVTHETVHKALDRVEENCKTNPGPFAADVEDIVHKIPATMPGAEQIQRLLRMAALTRDEAADHGTVMCLTGSEGARPKGLSADAFAQTRDLGALGNLRYVTASQGSVEEGEQDVTKVFAVWTEGHFRLDRLEPPVVGDAPGSDSVFVPRPPESVRIFSAEAVESPYSVRIYETNSVPEAVFAFYDRAMQGWMSYEPDGAEQVARGYVKQGRPVMVNVSHDESKTLVTISEMGVGGRPNSDRHPK